MGEVTILSHLLEEGVPFPQAVELSFNQHKTLSSQLMSGCSFASILKKQSDSRLQMLGLFLERMDLKDALLFFHRLEKSHQLLKTRIFKTALYPLFLMGFATVLVFFFSNFILPAMGEWTTRDSTAWLEILQVLLSLFWAATFSTGSLYGLLLIFPEHLWIGNFLIRFIPWLKLIASLQCAAFFEASSNLNMNTVDLFVLMKQSSHFPFAACFGYQWEAESKKGHPLSGLIQKDRRLDAAFVHCFLTGVSGQTMSKLMEAYQKSALFRLEKSMKKFSQILLLFAYGFIGLLALSIYQIMLEPLTMLESI